MERNKTIVEIHEPRTGRTLIRTLATSPVLVGYSPCNTLCLEDPTVAPIHGEIWFDDNFLSFGNLAIGARSVGAYDLSPVPRPRGKSEQTS